MDKERWGIRRIDLMPEKGRTILIYGLAGRGKTSLLNTLKGNVLLINIDCGEQVLNPDNPDNEFDICSLVSKNISSPALSVKKLKEFLRWLRSQETLPWDYVVVDNISEIENTFLQAIVEKRSEKIKSPDQNAYGEAGFEMLNILKDMRNLTYKGSDVIYIAWEKTEKVSDFGGEVHSEKGPMLIGQCQLKVNGLIDFVMAMRVDKKGNRYLQLDADHKYMAKKREEPGRSYPSIIHCPKDSVDVLHNFFMLTKGESNASDLRPQE